LTYLHVSKVFFINAFRHFVKTDKLLPEMYKTQCTDFINFFNRLLKLNDKNKKSIYEKEKLISELKSAPLTWLLNKTLEIS